MKPVRYVAAGLWLAVCPVPVAAQSTAVTSPPALAPAPLRFAAVVEEARALVVADLAARAYPGIAVAVSVDGDTVWSEGFGYADLEHRVPMWPSVKFRVGSISKSMTAAAVATLVEAGRLDLDVPIQRYVPSFPRKAHPITTRQLGGHLDGIRHYQGDENFIRDPYRTVTDALAIFQDDPLLHEPGSAFSYTSYGFNLISAVVEGAAGQPFLPYMREAVFEPIGMHETVADFVTSIIPQRTSYYVRDADGRRLMSHSGGSVGGTSLMIMQPDTGVVVVGLINLTRANNGVLREVLALFIDAAAASSDH